jgi:integrase
VTARPPQDVRFWQIQHRPGFAKPRVVRWVVDGRPFSQSFQTKPPAERYRARLIAAHDAGEWFSANHGGEPESWHPQGARTAVYDWARKWLAEQWDELAPRTRDSYTEAMGRFVPLVVRPGAPKPPARIHKWLERNLPPDVDVDPDASEERWLRKWGLALGDLDRPTLADVETNLGKGLRGQPLGAEMASRLRRYSKSCIRRAVALDLIPVDPWPPSQRGRSRRKANRVTHEVDIRTLPNRDGMRSMLEQLPNNNKRQASRRWQVMSAVGYYAAPRPSEVVMLRRRAIHLPHRPAGGWGLIEIVEADDGYDQSAEPKTGNRIVPIPPPLTAILGAYLAENNFAPADYIFRTTNGTRPRLADWCKALRRACRLADVPVVSPYGLRHAGITFWLQAGVALAEAAKRAGHSVQTLVGYYIQALQGDEALANQRIESALGSD